MADPRVGWYPYKLRDRTNRRYRETLGKAVLTGLEILVAADIIRTVALDATMSKMRRLVHSCW